MSTGWFALFGVIVGGLITGSVEFALQRRNEWRLRRSAGRLLGLELDEARLFIEASVEGDHWTAAPSRVLSNEQWMEYRSVWAAEDEAWQKVAGAFLKIAHVRQHYSRADAGTPVGDSKPGQERIKLALDAIAVARPLLDPSGTDQVKAEG